MRARDIMTVYPSVAVPQDTTTEAARVMRDRNVHVLPVVHDLQSQALVGILTDRDLVVRCMAAGHDGTCRVGDHMTSAPLVSVDADTEIADVVAKMRQYSFRRMPVLEHDRRLVGVVALADLVAKAPSSYGVLLDEIELQIHPPQPALSH